MSFKLKKCIFVAALKIIMYQILINIAEPILKCLSPFSKKIKKGVFGRKKTMTTLKSAQIYGKKNIWFHCASLGEYEQGLPVFNVIKKQYPDHNIVLSFFSPSGYEIRLQNPLTPIVCYLPIDTKKNAREFIEHINPELTVFVKYDVWPNYINELHLKKLKIILISALFRKNQIYFKPFGKQMAHILKKIDHIFTQDDNSLDLLKSIDYLNASKSGDTRFDRVYNQLAIDNTLDFIKKFKDNKICIVFGSSWKEDAKIFIDFINKNPENKYIIAPHNISKTEIDFLKSRIKIKTICYSTYKESDLTKNNCFIIDTIGLLSKIYSYADISYVGGGMGTSGLHNILEPATFGSPIIIGKNHSKFPEAKALINLKGVFSVSNKSEFEEDLQNLIRDDILRKATGSINKEFVDKNRGATNIIISELKRKI